VANQQFSVWTSAIAAGNFTLKTSCPTSYDAAIGGGAGSGCQ
jgi:hypothetical protein